MSSESHKWIPNPHDPTHSDNQCTVCGAIDCSSAGECPCPRVTDKIKDSQDSDLQIEKENGSTSSRNSY
jgi:hypothetical protein